MRPEIRCGKPGTVIKLRSSRLGSTALVEGVVLDPGFVRQLAEIVEFFDRTDPKSGAKGFESIRGFAGETVSLAFYIRSTEGIIYYLGEVVRRLLNPEFEQPRRIVGGQVGTAEPPVSEAFMSSGRNGP